jgi:hypothetical protein
MKMEKMTVLNLVNYWEKKKYSVTQMIDLLDLESSKHLRILTLTDWERQTLKVRNSPRVMLKDLGSNSPTMRDSLSLKVMVKLMH